MNRVIQFVPDGSYDNLLLLWSDIVIIQRKRGWNRALEKLQENQSYESHLPRDVFYKILNQGIEIILQAMLREFENFVFDLLYVELLKNTEYNRVQIGEFLLLRDLFYCFRDGGVLDFQGLVSAFASDEVNIKIFIKLACGLDEREFQ